MAPTARTSAAERFSDLNALFINCTLKPGDQTSNTQGLMDVVIGHMRSQGVSVDVVRAVNHDIAPGVQPDMREEGAASDDWPALTERVLAADILVIGTPIWLGDKSSVATRVVERLYSLSGWLNEKDQSVFYGKVGGAVVTGNEDGIKHVAMNLLYSLGHIGYTIPPQADAGWVGEAGPGPSYLDEGSGGPENEFTQQNSRILAWNLMHFASMLKEAGGIPAEGNTR
ncbi:flavodoxin family protein [Kytococcus sedentarius]|uniref:flavodoxin family protein n=1 Tax=Kytococcus sedentarius TaxID=1276 RepID=UPI0035BC1048